MSEWVKLRDRWVNLSNIVDALAEPTGVALTALNGKHISLHGDDAATVTARLDLLAETAARTADWSADHVAAPDALLDTPDHLAAAVEGLS